MSPGPNPHFWVDPPDLCLTCPLGVPDRLEIADE
jgi:hypothetical protein